MSYRDEVIARLDALEARVSALESEEPAESEPSHGVWERTVGGLFRKRAERFEGPENCGHCEHWDHKHQKWGRDLDHDLCDFPDDKLHAACALKPRKMHDKNRDCSQFYPAKRFWRPVSARVGRRIKDD